MLKKGDRECIILVSLTLSVALFIPKELAKNS